MHLFGTSLSLELAPVKDVVDRLNSVLSEVTLGTQANEVRADHERTSGF